MEWGICHFAGMGSESGEIDGFVFSVGEFEGRRLIEVVFSERISSARLSLFIDPFCSLWDDERPSLQIVDASGCEGLDAEAHEFLKALIRRTVHLPGHLATAWIVGDNARVANDVTWLLTDAVHVTDGIVRTRAEAEGFLRRFLDLSTDQHR
jgi:hypothetical protein